MKRIFLVGAVAVFVLCASPFSFGHSQLGATPVLLSVYYEVLDEPGCPLSITLKPTSRIPAAPLTVTNNGTEPLRAFVIYVSGASRFFDNSHTVFAANGLAPDESRDLAVGVGALSQTATKPIISVDYAHFANGTNWGKDVSAKSGDIKSFLQGYDLAVQRLKELAGDDNADFLKAVVPYGRMGIGGSPANHPMRDPFYKGYEGVIKALRNMRTRTVEAREIARKLEIAENSSR